jgi:hypothetical protein
MPTRRKRAVHCYINKLKSLKYVFYTTYNFFVEFEAITYLNMAFATFWIVGYVHLILPDDGD